MWNVIPDTLFFTFNLYEKDPGPKNSTTSKFSIKNLFLSA